MDRAPEGVRGMTMKDKDRGRRVLAHVERAERAGARAEAVATEAEARAAIARQALHNLAAAEELLVASGKRTRAEVRASRCRRK